MKTFTIVLEFCNIQKLVKFRRKITKYILKNINFSLQYLCVLQNYICFVMYIIIQLFLYI